MNINAFRVWDIENKRYIETQRCFIDGNGEFYYHCDDGKLYNWKSDFSIERCTGYRYYDTGEPIFFGDIVKAPSGLLLEVIWYDDEFKIALRGIESGQIYNFNIPLYTKYGTIHDTEKQ
jgi:hypothetical protein